MNPTTDNAASQSYDYTTSGMDGFLSRSLDEVSWQNTLGAYYNTLGTYPIGTSPTTSTPINYDASQISGSQGGATTAGGNAGDGTSNGIVIDPSSNTITLNQGNIQING